MVVQRTLDKIEEIKERPHHERRTIALYWAVGITTFLMLFWGFFAVRGIGKMAVRLTQQQEAPQAAVQTASAVAAADTILFGEPQPLTASSTNGRVELVPAGR